MGSCEKRRARVQGEGREEEGQQVKEEPEEQQEGEGDKQVRRVARVKRYNKGRADEVLGQMQSAIRQVRRLILECGSNPNCVFAGSAVGRS